MRQNHLAIRSEISDDDSRWLNIIIIIVVVIVYFSKRILVCGVESKEAEVKLRYTFADRVDDLDAGHDGENSRIADRPVHIDRRDVDVGADDDSTCGCVACQARTNANRVQSI